MNIKKIEYCEYFVPRNILTLTRAMAVGTAGWGTEAAGSQETSSPRNPNSNI